MHALVDFHCHLDLYPDFENLVSQKEQAQVYTLAVTTTPRAWERNRDLTSGNEYVKAALGLHPQLVGQFEHELALWKRYLSETRFVGEVGLDAGPGYFKTLPAQIRVFKQMAAACAEAGGKVLTVHSVRAAKEVLDVLSDTGVFERNQVVLHWFTGSLAEARRAVSLGCYFSINEQMLLNDRGHTLLGLIPRSKLLTETDVPFTRAGNVPRQPGDVQSCLRRIGDSVRKPVEMIQEQVAKNASLLFAES